MQISHASEIYISLLLYHPSLIKPFICQVLVLKQVLALPLAILPYTSLKHLPRMRKQVNKAVHDFLE